MTTTIQQRRPPSAEFPSNEIQRVWVVGTAHITKCDNDLLECGEWPYSMLSWEHGFWLWVPGLDWLSTDDWPGEIKVVRAAGFSQEICDLWQAAVELGVEWLRFDSDGPIIDHRPVFHW